MYKTLKYFSNAPTHIWEIHKSIKQSSKNRTKDLVTKLFLICTFIYLYFQQKSQIIYNVFSKLADKNNNVNNNTDIHDLV